MTFFNLVLDIYVKFYPRKNKIKYDNCGKFTLNVQEFPIQLNIIKLKSKINLPTHHIHQDNNGIKSTYFE